MAQSFRTPLKSLDGTTHRPSADPLAMGLLPQVAVALQRGLIMGTQLRF
jgi:hypothetical protein